MSKPGGDEPDFAVPSCYSDILTEKSTIICAGHGYGKTRLMNEAHRHISRSSYSVRVKLDASVQADMLAHVWQQALVAFWEQLSATPDRFAAIAAVPFYRRQARRAIEMQAQSAGADWQARLERLALYRPDLESAINAVLYERIDNGMLAPSTVLGFVERLIDLAEVLHGTDSRGASWAYVWLDVQDDFDWVRGGSTLRELARCKARVAVKSLVTPTVLARLTTPGANGSANDVDIIHLSWEREQLTSIASDVCMKRTKRALDDLVPKNRWQTLLAHAPNFFEDSPRAWQTLGDAISHQWQAQGGGDNLKEDYWYAALCDHCRTCRKLRFDGNAIYAGHELLKLNPMETLILRVLADWQNDAQRPTERPSAKQLATEINKRRPSSRHKVASEGSVHTAISRMRSEKSSLEVVHGLHRLAGGKAVQPNLLVYLQGDNGYILDNLDNLAGATSQASVL